MVIKLSLSLKELCIAILIESHTVVSTCLFEFVLSAAKASYHTDWRDKICSCVGVGVGQYVKQCLENNIPMTDIYVVCRIIACLIHDVAKFCGGNLLNPREKERLCLQIGGVETARHWAFHCTRDQHVAVSPGEVRSSTALLKSVITTLSRQSEADLKMSRVLKELSVLLEYADSLVGSNTEEEYNLRQSSISSAFLHSSFTELERMFVKFFYEDGANDNLNNGDALEEFPTILKQVKKAIQERLPKRKKSQQFGGGSEKLAYISMCKKLLAIRNALAHNAPLVLSEIQEALHNVSKLLDAFGLGCDRTTSAKIAITLMDAEQSQEEEVWCCILEDGMETNATSCERLLRPQGQYFVGRERETLSIKAFLTDREACPGSCAVLIFGPAGVGKSYLATHVAYELVKVYSMQTWLSCSNKPELVQHLQLCQSHTKSNNGAASKLHLKNVGHHKEDCSHMNNHLFIFDDVCSSTMHLVYEEILKGNLSSVMTTRSTAVRRFFQRVLPFLHVIKLRPFSSLESWSLLERNIKFKLGNLEDKIRISIGRTLSRALGHLPLCVSIYSSLLAHTLRKNRNTNEQDVEFQSSYMFESWKVIEECFGDHLHVRGLTGIMECAEYYLQDHPLLVILLAKICLAETDRIPWKVLRKTDSLQMQIIYKHITTTTAPAKALSGLIDVIDWFFSDGGQDTLEICRNTLEELGLISWENSTSTVCIHLLTLGSVRGMFQRRGLFLGNLFANSLSHNGDMNHVTIWNVTALWLVSGALLLQILGNCLKVLGGAVREARKDCDLEEALSVFEFLAKFVEKGIPFVLRELLTLNTLGVLKSNLVRVLYNFSFSFGIKVSHVEMTSWVQTYKQYPFSTKSLREIAAPVQLREAACQYEHGMTGLANANLDKLLSKTQSSFGANSYHVAALHCLKADFIAKERGSSARKMYLWNASQTCPRLLREPTFNDLHSAICSILQADDYCRTEDLHNRRQFMVWYFLTLFKLQDCSAVGAELQCASLLLLILSQQRQRLIVKKLNENGEVEKQLTSKKTLECSFLVSEATDEAMLWYTIRKRGRGLRALVRTYQVIDKILIKHTNIMAVKTHRVTEGFFYQLIDLIERICIDFWLNGELRGTLALFISILQVSQKASVVQDFSPNKQWNGFVPLEYIDHELCRELCAPIQCFHELQGLYEGKDFQCVLNRLVIILKQSLGDNKSRAVVHGEKLKYIRVTLGYVVSLCVILGQTKGLDAFKQLVLLSESTKTPLPWKAVLNNSIAQISASWKQIEQFSVYDSCVQSRKDFAAGKLRCAKKTSLECWRNLIYLLKELSANNQAQSFMFEIFNALLLELASVLKQLYVEERKCSIAMWFLDFCIRWTKKRKRYFLTANYGIEFAKFLRESARYQEALEQCQNVERELVEEFGDDYSEWLLDMAVEISSLLKELEKQSQTESGQKISNC